MSVFRIKTAIHHGPAAVDILKAFTPGRVLIVTDDFLAKSPMMELVLATLAGAEVTVFSDVTPDPGIDVVRAGLKAFLATDPQALIALGGGSPMDAAKAIHQIVRQQGNGNCACIAIPTTSGSGSEVTSVAVITDEKKSRKLPLISQTMLPDIAILDPDFTASVPPNITADTGMDVLTHAVEAYVATGSSDFTDAFAEKAIELVLEFLPRAFLDGSDMVAREHMLNASNMAALAFDHAGLGITHSLAHAVGGEFHKAHGRLNAMFLPHVIEFNAGKVSYGELSETAQRYARLGHVVLAAGGSQRHQISGFVDAIRNLNKRFDIPNKITGLGVARADYRAAIPRMAESAAADACTETNPREVTVEQFKELFGKLV